MKEQKLATLSIIATVALIALAIAACIIVRPAEAVEPRPDYAFTVDANDVTNQRVLKEMQLEKLRELHDKMVDKWEARQAEEEAARLAEEQAAWEAEQAYYAQQYYAPTYVDYGSSGGAEYGENGPTRSMPGYYDGHKETYFSSNVLYHYKTPEWTVDDEGFYHDENGYYVVGVGYDEFTTTRPLGTIIETGKGEAIVCDTGYTAEPLVDFYTNW